jgi:hypothetical protein
MDESQTSNNEYVTKLLEQFLPYTERHSARLGKLAQQIMFIDYCWQNMKLNENIDDKKEQQQERDSKRDREIVLNKKN